MVYSNLNDACNEAMHAAGAFINCAAASFYWSFRVRPIFTTTSLKNNENNDDFDQDNDDSSLTNADKIETLHTDEKVVVYLNSLSRMTLFLASLSSNGGSGSSSGGNSGSSTSPPVSEQLPSSSLITADRNAEFYLKFSIWHGIRQMDSVVIKLDRLERMMSKKVDSFIKPHR